MYEHIKRTRYTRKDTRRRYRVFFAAPVEFNLVQYLQNLKRTTKFSILKGKGSNVQTIEISLRPSQLRELLDEVPEEVVVAYETTKDPLA